MLRPGGNDTVRTLVTASSARSPDMYQRHAAGLYRQALLTLGDPALAAHVVRDVIAGECALAPAPRRDEDDTRYRPAESVLRRCQQLATNPAQRGCHPAQPPPGDAAGRVDPGGFLSEKAREALGLVLIGGLGRVRASSVLGICPRIWRPPCARHCSGWQPLRPPLSRTAVR